MLCVTGVFIRDITNTIFVILHVNMSRMSVCCFCVFLEGGEVGLGHIFDILACTRIFFFRLWYLWHFSLTIIPHNAVLVCSCLGLFQRKKKTFLEPSSPLTTTWTSRSSLRRYKPRGCQVGKHHFSTWWWRANAAPRQLWQAFPSPVINFVNMLWMNAVSPVRKGLGVWWK